MYELTDSPIELHRPEGTGVCAGYYGFLEGDFYAPCVSLSKAEYYVLFRINNLADVSKDIYLIVTAIKEKGEETSAYKISIDSFEYKDVALVSDIKEPHFLVLEVGYETTLSASEEPPIIREITINSEKKNIFITHRQSIAVHIGGDYAPEKGESDYDVCYFQVYYSGPSGISFYEPYPVISSIYFYTETPQPHLIVPTFRFNGRKNKEAAITLWNFSRSSLKKYTSKFRYSTTEEVTDFETLFEDFTLGYEKYSALVYAMTTLKTKIDNYLIIHAIGEQPEWWKFWDWKAEDSHVLTIGDIPEYVEFEATTAVARTGIPSKEELDKFREDLEKESQKRGIPVLANSVAYEPSELGWGGYVRIKGTAPGFKTSPAVLAIVIAIVLYIIVPLVLSAIGLMITIYYTITKPLIVEQPYICPVCGKRFKSKEQLKMHIDSEHPDYAKEQIPDKDPFTGEDLPEDAKKSLYNYNMYLLANHPEEMEEIDKDLGLAEEEELDIMPILEVLVIAIAFLLIISIIQSV